MNTTHSPIKGAVEVTQYEVETFSPQAALTDHQVMTGVRQQRVGITGRELVDAHGCAGYYRTDEDGNHWYRAGCEECLGVLRPRSDLTGITVVTKTSQAALRKKYPKFFGDTQAVSA